MTFRNFSDKIMFPQLLIFSRRYIILYSLFSLSGQINDLCWKNGERLHPVSQKSTGELYTAARTTSITTVANSRDGKNEVWSSVQSSCVSYCLSSGTRFLEFTLYDYFSPFREYLIQKELGVAKMQQGGPPRLIIGVSNVVKISAQPSFLFSFYPTFLYYHILFFQNDK